MRFLRLKTKFQNKANSQIGCLYFLFRFRQRKSISEQMCSSLTVPAQGADFTVKEWNEEEYTAPCL